ncbi:amidoligase family protein [Gemmiger formicilis]|uniref:amidoligase family protein n=1 Tax=Gemmiger formicilis TaxID=745368 RepID=UPI003CEEF18D
MKEGISHEHHYHALNLHSVFYHGTVEWRLFNSTLHAGEVKANIILATLYPMSSTNTGCRCSPYF